MKRAIKTQDLEAISELREKLAVFGAENYYHTSGFQHPPMLLEYKDKFDVAKWGLVPSWINDERAAADIRTKTINARLETLESKASFKQAFDQGRAVLMVDGFFDFQKNQKKKTPHFLHLENKESFALACVSDIWVNEETGEVLNSFTIVTQKGSGIIEKIHSGKEPRLPVILKENSIESWLAEGEIVPNNLGDQLISHKVAPLSGNRYKGNIPEVIEEEPDLDGEQFSLF